MPGLVHGREFTIVGDIVNVVFRTEQIAQLVEERIVLSEKTRIAGGRCGIVHLTIREAP